jgi:hypothetical protein
VALFRLHSRCIHTTTWRPQRLPRPGGALLGQIETDGCSSGSLPLGTPVEVTGASRPGTLVYSSWLTMQANGETDADTCAYNDLALIRIDPADADRVNPSVPGFGGPTGIGGAGGSAPPSTPTATPNCAVA